MGKVLIDGSTRKVLVDPTVHKILVDATVVPCTHKLQFQFLISTAEFAYGGSSGSLFSFKGFEMWPEYTDGANTWTLDDPDGNDYTIPFDPDTMPDTWHDFELVLVSDGTSITYTWSVDGVEASPVVTTAGYINDVYWFNDQCTGDQVDRLLMGSRNPFGSESHRSITNVKILDNNPADDNGGGGPFFTIFDFPAVSTFFEPPGCPYHHTGGTGCADANPDYNDLGFGTFCGTGVSFPGGTLRVDETSGAAGTGPGGSVFARLTSPLGVVCCCDDSVVDNVGDIKFEIDISVSDDCPPDCAIPAATGCFEVSLHLEKTWTRIAEGTPGESEYTLKCSEKATGGQQRKEVEFLVGWNSGPYGEGIHVVKTFGIVDYTGPFISCCNPAGDPPPCDPLFERIPDMASFLDAGVGIGPQGDPACGGMTITPYISTGGFGCKNDTTPAQNCGDIIYDDIPPDDFALEDLIGVHTWHDSRVSGSRTWEINWKLTINPA